MNIADWPKATAELEALVKKQPDPNSRGLLAAVYYRGGRLADSQKLVAQLIEENNQDANAHLLNGLMHLDAREYDVAASEFEHILHYRADSASAQYLLALASYGAGKEQLAQQQMERALELNHELLPARLWLVDYHLRRGSVSVALDLARGAPGRQAYAPEIIIMTALCDPLTPLNPQQQVALQRALLARPRLIPAYENLGMITLLRKYGTPLREQLEAVAEKHPELRAVRALVLTILEAQGKQDQVIAQMQKKVAANPKSSLDLLTLAKLQIRRGDLQAARANLERAMAIEPDNPAMMARMAELEEDAGNINAALARLNDLTNRYPKFSEGWSFKAIVYEQRRQAAEARGLYEQALQLDSRNAVAANNLAWLLATSFQELPEGLELARRAHRLDPANAAFADTLGWILFLAGNYTEALEPLGDAVRINPEDATIRYHLGLAESRAGRIKEALENLKAALLLNPKLPEAEEIRAELTGLSTRAARSGAVR